MKRGRALSLRTMPQISLNSSELNKQIPEYFNNNEEMNIELNLQINSSKNISNISLDLIFNTNIYYSNQR